MEKKEKYMRCSAEELAWCADYCRKYWPEEVKHILRIAEEVLRNEFVFDLPWDMEPTTEPVRFSGEIQWDYMPGEDPEFIYQFNRHRYWICLGQAYALTGEEKYVQCFLEQLRSWMGANPINERTEKTTWRTIEAGLRAENWCKAMSYMAHSLLVTEEDLGLFEQGLNMHGEYLYRHEVPFSDKSNWGVLENSGLYRIGKVLGRQEYSNRALERLYREAGLQVLPDGVHWEQSPMYHNEVLHCFLEVLHMARRYGEPLSEEFFRRVRQMAWANAAWMKPNGCQPAAGDSDETDIRDILAVSGYQLKDTRLCFLGHDRLGFEAVWDYGREAAEEYAAMGREEPEDTDFALKESGNWFWRSGWGKDADYVHFKCGNLGGGHGHMDKLHVDITIGGEDILVDSGRYTYVPGRERSGFKSAAAHNTLLADEEEYTQCLDAWDVSGMTLPVNTFGSRQGIYRYAEGGHPGYWKKGILLNRRVVSLGSRIHILADEAWGSGTHTYSRLFHFNPEGRVKLSREKAEFTYTGSRAGAVFVTLPEEAEAASGSCMISGTYNRKQPAACVSVSHTLSGFGSMITVCLGWTGACEPYKVRRTAVTAPAAGKELPENIAEGIIVEYGKEAWLLVIRHCETASGCEYIGAEGRYGMGQVMVCSLNTEKEFTILKW